jgi:chitinase
MSVSHSSTVRTAALLLSLSLVPIAATRGQRLNQNSASVSIDPTEVTVHVGGRQIFKAVIKGTHSSGIRWSLQEPNGGQITEHGTYTAPRHLGLYHVVATSEEDPDVKAVAKVTVVTEYDTPEWLKNPKP